MPNFLPLFRVGVPARHSDMWEGKLYDNLTDNVSDGYHWLHEHWIRYSEWFTGYPSAEAGAIATALVLILVGSSVLSVVMVSKRPRTTLEKMLFVRELFLTFLLTQFVAGLLLDIENVWLRTLSYIGTGIASLVVAFVIFKEYTFDVWEIRERQEKIDMEQGELDDRQDQLTLDRREFRKRVDR